MAMYYFDNKVISRSNKQSAVAKSAYISGQKIKDYNEDSYKDFSNKQCDYSEILLPKNAPDDYKDREYLWNKVHQIEKRKDSQLAREIVIALPNEFSNEDNVELTKDFAHSLKEEGMIVDLNIHKLEGNNPHAHLLCTLRGFNENGEFEPKRKGNEFIRDWNTKEKNLEWRERWANIQNKHLEKHGFLERVSHQSYKEQGLDIQPTLKEGWKSRKYFKETGKLSNKANYNSKIKKENRDKIQHLYSEKKLNPYDYINKDQARSLSSISKELKVFISPKTLMEKTNYIDDLSAKSLLISNTDKQKEQLEKANNELRLVDKAKEIFNAQANYFFEENYSEKFDINNDDKIYLTHYMIENDTILNPKDFTEVINKKIEEEQIDSLNTILSNKDISHENIEKEKQFFMDKLNKVLEDNNVDFDSIENHSEDDYKDNDFNKVLYYSSKLDKLALADNILENYYDNRISKLFGDDQENIDTFKEVTNAEEKKDIVDFIDFYGEEKTLYVIETGKYNMRFDEEERQDIITNSMLITEKLNNKYPTDRDTFIVNNIKKEMNEKYNIDMTNSNDIKFVFREALLNEDNNINQKITMFEEKADKYNYQYKPTNFSDIHRSVNSLVYSMNEIFKDRMPKYQNKQLMQSQSKRRARGQGLT